MKALFFLIPAVFLLFPLSVTETNGDLSLQDKSVSALTDTVWNCNKKVDKQLG